MKMFEIRDRNSVTWGFCLCVPIFLLGLRVFTVALGPFDPYKRRSPGSPGCPQDCVQGPMINPPIFLSFVNKVDFWRGPARPSLPVDMRVPFSELKDVKAYLESHGLAYSIMIKDIQVRPCPQPCSWGLTFHMLFWLGPNTEEKHPELKVDKGDRK